MPIAIRSGPSVNRRQFLARSTATCAVAGLGSIARPYLSRAADRPLITSGIQSGDVSADSAVIWARADRPRGCRSSVRRSRISRPSSARLPPMRCPTLISPRKLLLGGLPAGTGHFLSRAVREHRERHCRRNATRSFPHRARSAQQHIVRLVGRYRGAGLGHRRQPRRHADVPHHARQPSGLLHPFRRPYLCGLPGGAGIETARWRRLAKHRHGREIGGRPSPRRSFAATTNTTGSTRIFAPSMPRCRCSRNGTITR